MIFKTQKQKIKLASDYILNDDLEGLRKLFEKGFNPNSEAINGKSLWIYALRSDKEEAFALIKEYKALYKLPKRVKAAFISIRNSDIQTLQELTSKGVDPNSKDAEGATLLNRAVFDNHVEITKLLLELKGYQFSEEYAHPLISASDRSMKITNLLLDHKIHSPEVLERVFIIAASNDNIELAQTLLNNNLDLKHCGKKAFLKAASEGNKAFIVFLMQHGYELNTLYNDENVLMSIASSRFKQGDDHDKKMAFVRELITMGADPNIENTMKQKPYDIAMHRDNTELAALLKKHMNYDNTEIIKKLKTCHLPEQVIAYLTDKSTKKAFNWPDKRNITEVKLNELDEILFSSLRISTWEYRENEHSHMSRYDPNIEEDGAYSFTAIDLVHSVNSYDQSGILIWIPELRQFGTADTSHGVVYIFKDIKWDSIISDLHYYANYQWSVNPNDNIVDIYEYCNPWELWTYK